MARFNTQSITTSVAAAGTIASAQAFTEFTGTAPYTVTLPSPVLCPGSSQTFYNATSGTVTISTPSGIFGGLGASGAGTQAIPTNTVVSVTSDGVNYIVLSEDGSALVATTGSFTGNVTANGASATVSLTPQTVTIAPTGASTIDNVNIGATTRGSGTFNTLTANSAVTFTANTTSSSTATGSLVVTGGVGVSGAVYAAGLNGPLTGNVTGTIQTAAQPNITSVGALTGLAVDTNTIYVDATNHRLGVGTAGPAYKFDVQGGRSVFSANSEQYILGLRYSSASTGVWLGSPADNSFAIYNFGGGQYLYINASGKVGINVTPAAGTDAKLQVTGGTTNVSSLLTAYSTAAVVVVPKSSSGYSLAIASGPGDLPQIQVSANGTASGNLLIQPYGGNVGIGTTSPSTRLDIDTGSTTNAGAQLLVGPSSGTAAVGDKVVIGFKLQNTAGGGTGNTYAAGIGGVQDASGQNSGALAFYTQYSSGDGTPERMRISNAGNVGIGTNNPQYQLAVGGSIGLLASSYNRLLATQSQWGYSSGYRTLILGSASSTYTTDVSGAVTLAFGVDVSGNSSASFTGDGRELIFRNIASFITPNSGNTGYLNLLAFNNGNVGIGNSVPGYKLEVTATGGGLDTAVVSQSDIGGGIAITSTSNGQNSRVGIVFRGSDNIGAAIASAREDSGSTWKTYMAFYTNNLTGASTLNLQEKMRLNSSGVLSLTGTTGTAGVSFPSQLDGSLQSTPPVFTGMNYKFIGSFTLRNGSQYLDIQTNQTSGMIAVKAEGYLYNQVLVIAYSCGYLYTSTQFLARQDVNLAPQNPMTLYRSSASPYYMGIRFNRGTSSYSEGQINVYVSMMSGGEQNAVSVLQFAQNNTAGQYY